MLDDLPRSQVSLESPGSACAEGALYGAADLSGQAQGDASAVVDAHGFDRRAILKPEEFFLGVAGFGA